MKLDRGNRSIGMEAGFLDKAAFCRGAPGVADYLKMSNGDQKNARSHFAYHAD
jgi:hypothetical protein